MATSAGLGQAVEQGALTFAEGLLALGWTPDNVAAHVLTRYGYLQGAEGEQITKWAVEALAAGDTLQGASVNTLVSDSGAPCVPGLAGGDWNIGYRFTWINPNTGQEQSWYGTMNVPPFTSLSDVFEMADQEFADTVGETYFGGDPANFPTFDFAIESVICPT